MLKLVALMGIFGLIRAVTIVVPTHNDQAWEITTFDTTIHNAWRTNFDSCQSRGMMMLEIFDENMNTQVKELLANSNRYTGIWLGLMYTAGKEFLWISGERFRYSSWSPSFPDPSRGKYYTNIRKNGKWVNSPAQDNMMPTCMKKIKVVSLQGEAVDSKKETRFNADIEPMDRAKKPVYKQKVYLDGFILHVGEEKTDWLSAYYFCKKKGLSLPTVITETLNNMLMKQAKEMGSLIWLALVGAGGRFWWMNGVPFEYSQLVDGYNAEGRSSIYIVIQKDGKWYDSCSFGAECIKAFPLCMEIAPTSTGKPGGTDPVISTTKPRSPPPSEIGALKMEDKKERETEVRDKYFTTTGPQQRTTASLEMSDCQKAVQVAEKRKALSSAYVYIPTCRSDGEFTPSQCGKDSCWCVEQDGSPITKTITKDRVISDDECSDFRGDVSFEIKDKEKEEENKPVSEILRNLCVIEARLYKQGQKFMQGCNSCTCWGNNEFTCSVTTACQSDETQVRNNTLIQHADPNSNEPVTDESLFTDNSNNEGEYRKEFDTTTESSTDYITEEGKVFLTTGPEEEQYKITLYLTNKVTTWIEAYYGCKEAGMTLPTDLNEVMNNYVQNYLRQHNTETWIDAEQSNGYAYWISGAEMSFTKWAPYSDPSYNYNRRAYVTLSYDGMWYAKEQGAKSNYYCMKTERMSPKAVKMGYTGYCLIGDKQYYQGETFGSTCNRCTCYLYAAIYVDCVRVPDCVDKVTEPPKPVTTASKKTTVRRVKSKCHGGLRYLDCSSSCVRKCQSKTCRRHCTELCSCPPDKPIFYGGCCVAESVCIDDGYEAVGFY